MSKQASYQAISIPSWCRLTVLSLQATGTALAALYLIFLIKAGSGDEVEAKSPFFRSFSKGHFYCGIAHFAVWVSTMCSVSYLAFYAWSGQIPQTYQKYMAGGVIVGCLLHLLGTILTLTGAVFDNEMRSEDLGFFPVASIMFQVLVIVPLACLGVTFYCWHLAKRAGYDDRGHTEMRTQSMGHRRLHSLSSFDDLESGGESSGAEEDRVRSHRMDRRRRQ
ncbi:hypothetical protein OIV83_000717 [Microbotryomycetes sp. JL201]|nr:hypothetical protein OIV83_000717 [Microbotryomycetes sp. JL201]